MQNETFIESIQNSAIYSNFADFFNNPITKILLVLIIVYVAKKFGMLIIRRAVRRSVRGHNYATEHDEQQRENTVVSIIDALVRFVVWAIAVMIILSTFGIDIAPLLAGASIAGVALGFGMQSLVKDLVSGLFIIMENQYRIGDWVEIAGASGTVESINMRVTVLRDFEGNQHHVPNGEISVATNKTMEFAKLNVEIGVSYDTDIDKAAKILNEVGEELAADKDFKDKITSTPQFLRVSSFGDSAINLFVLGETHAGDQWSVAGEYRLRLKKAFDKAKIEIPFNQLVVHQASKKK